VVAIVEEEGEDLEEELGLEVKGFGDDSLVDAFWSWGGGLDLGRAGISDLD